VDLAELTKLLQLLAERDITEFELEEQGMRLRIRKTASVPAPASPAVAPPAAGASSLPAAAPVVPPASGDAPAAAAPAPAAEAGLVVMKSPMVGTFYRASEPTAPSFVAVGDHVRVGQVLCIIEAMKLMNELEAEVAGEIVKVHPENGQPVQFGDPLFTIRPER
jgi:acetyl-CoA carboxylase biotin carboxyl carrier protein